MKISTSTSILEKKGYRFKEIVDIAAEAGFDALDFSFTLEKYYDEETDGEQFKKEFIALKEYANGKGVCFNQAHAPFHSSSSDPVWTEKRFFDIVRSMRNASYLGIPVIVVHPIQHLTYNDSGVPERLFELNMEFYKRLLPYCEKYNIQVAVENMWQYVGKKITHSTCSRPEEFIRYLDELNSEWIVACLDIGHATLVGEKAEDCIRALGQKRLKALHVHDVDGIEDSHTLPYFGIVNWAEVASALKEIGYQGDFTYEAGSFLTNYPKDLVPTGLAYMAKIGKYIVSDRK